MQLPQKGCFEVLYAIASCLYWTAQLLMGYPFGSSVALQPCFLSVASPILLVNIGMSFAIYCGKASVQSFSLAFTAYPLLCWVPPCCSLTKPIGRTVCLFLDTNEPLKHQTWATKPLTILRCCGHPMNRLLSKKESWLTSTHRQSIEQLYPQPSALLV